MTTSSTIIAAAAILTLTSSALAETTYNDGGLGADRAILFSDSVHEGVGFRIFQLSSKEGGRSLELTKGAERTGFLSALFGRFVRN